METIMITIGALIGIALGAMGGSYIFEVETAQISAFLGAMIGALAGGWIFARIVNRLS